MASIVIGIQTARECGVNVQSFDKKMADETKPEEAKKEETKKEICSDDKKNLGNISYLLNLLGGLISATVVGVLAATQTNDLPAKNFFKAGLGNAAQGVAAYIPLAYILVWIFCGLFVVIFGLMMYDNDPSPPLTAHAKTWLGTAVAAIYAYIGISPEGNSAARPAITEITIAPASLNLTSANPSQKLSATAADAQKTPILNLPSDRFLWKCDKPEIATVDQTGLVTWIKAGDCIVTATTNAVTSNECAVKCS